MDAYAPAVRAYCLQRRIQEADLDDISQEVMSRVASSVRRFEYDPSKGHFRAWLGTITANQIKTFLTKDSRRLSETSAITNLSLPYVDPDSEWIAIFSERVFEIACRRIRDQTSHVAWQCFEATWIRKQRPADVAQLLCINTHAVYVHKSRVLKRLEDEIRILAEDIPVP